MLDDFLALGDGPTQFRIGVRPGPASATVELDNLRSLGR